MTTCPDPVSQIALQALDSRLHPPAIAMAMIYLRTAHRQDSHCRLTEAGPRRGEERRGEEMGTWLLPTMLIATIIPDQWSGAQGNSWSLQVSRDVTGEIGKDAFLPCWFSHPHKSHHGGLTVIWRVKQPYNGTVVFKCTSDHSNDHCRATVNHMNKFQLIGNIRNNNVSISIKNLTWADSNRYHCRVELAGDRHDGKYEAKAGTWLHVAAPPRIVNISVGFDHLRGYHAVCIAEGEPVPSLVWRNPEDHQQDALLTSGALKHQKATELHYLHQDGRYTCVATNSHGRVEGSVFFFRFKPESSGGSFVYLTLWTALGAKVLMLLLMVALAAYYNKDKTNSMTDILRMKAQESPYENDTQRTN